MEKQKRWQFYLIVAVLVLTLYNILPTVFFYSKPLKSPIDEPRAEMVASDIIDRVNQIESDSKDWLYSFARLVGVKPVSIELVSTNSGLFDVALKNDADAELFARFLPRAGSLIPFVPAQLELSPETKSDTTHVFVQRNVQFVLDPSEINQLFQYTPKYENDNKVADLYRDIVDDRVTQMALAIGGPSKTALQMDAVVNHATQAKPDRRYDEAAIALAKEIVDVESVFGVDSPITKRYYAHFAQIGPKEGEGLVTKFIAKLETLQKSNTTQKDMLQKRKEAGHLDPASEQQLAVANSQAQALEGAINSLRKNSAEFQKNHHPMTAENVKALLNKGANNQDQYVNLEGYHPFIKGLNIHWDSSKIDTLFYPDIQAIRMAEGNTEKEAFLQEKVNHFIINDIARIARLSDENFRSDADTFVVDLDTLSNSKSYLTMHLGHLASKLAQQVQDQLLLTWTPAHADLIRDAYPIHSYDEFTKLKAEDQKLGLVIYAPSMYAAQPPAGFRNGSVYVIAKGMDAIVQKAQEAPESPDSQLLATDFNRLNTILKQMGFIGYAASAFDMPKEYSKDFIFELNDFYSSLLKGSREDFIVRGSKRLAVLDFSDVEQRILTTNKIEDLVQEDLLKWQEAYHAAQVDLNLTSRYTIPAPTKNVYWQNFKLSFKKYFRGDDRKILKWGLDLSGGKTVRIALLDQNGRPVTNPSDINQAVNELYERVNKMGVAERTIRVENSNILLDFPGSQNLSAAELIKASAMFFHIVNEKFTPQNEALASSVNQFLQEVWNEAVVTNRKDVDSINEIAYQHLGGDDSVSGALRPRSDSAKLLHDNGLRLANPREKEVSPGFNDTLSSVAIYRGDETADWYGQSYPLIFVFHNYALEGANLENIQAGYDSTQGNILSFGVKRSYEGSQERGGSGSPRDDFYTWTAQFAEDKIQGTPKETYSHGRGWRMAVILNGSIITAPTLNAALRDGGTISGRFSQREVTQLAADLKAGSLSFTPRILSEENVSPELGLEERTKGIVASLIALVLVVVAMVGYYRFAGLVASVAVLLNIFIMWGVLQNLGAALTLPGIAGIVLTIGMAVDANVLVFERIREEFKLTGRIASAIQAGYRKAFSAIVDSNITTIIAALILIQFDSGPIKGFAVVLIIGILSSMFTSLFMTRYFFAGWVRNPEHKHLTMAQFLKETHFDFLKQAKKAIVISVVVMLIGTYFFVEERKTLFGMDFTGGYSLTADFVEKPGSVNYRLDAANALLDHGASSRDFEIRELSRPNQLRIQLGTSMNESGHPFYQMAETNEEGKYAYDYQKNPRLNWVVNALHDGGLDIQPADLTNLQNSWTTMSGQLSDAMRNNAILALGAALIAILLYITFRFEFKFAIGAVVGLIHDVIITVGILAMFHALGFAVQIDLQVIGAIMTIIGYSLNDTIIVFDRIREDIKLMKRAPFKDVINHALNVTLSRTIMTSGTTLLVLLALVLFGGKSIFSFSLVMTIGVLIGTLSSLFIASPVMLYFHNKELEHTEAKKAEG